MICYFDNGKATNSSDSSCHREIRAFFGTDELPELALDDNRLLEMAQISVEKGYNVTGVQKKFSLHLSKSKGEKPRLTLIDCPSGYILKPQTDEYRQLPEMEYLAMRMATSVGIKTVPFALIKEKENSAFAYLTKRVDRLPQDKKLPMEDFCQLSNKVTEDKYKGSYESCAKIIDKFSSLPLSDKTEMFLRIVFSFAIGNSDMHLKNFSLRESFYGSNEYVLSEAYDLLSVNVVLPEDLDELALSLNGKQRHLRKNDFLSLARYFGLSNVVGNRLIKKVADHRSVFLSMVGDSLVDDVYKTEMKALINKRINILINANQDEE